MKTLIAVDNPKLKNLIFEDEVVKKLESFSEVCWIEQFGDKPLEDIISEFDACITSWGSKRFTPEVLDRAEKLTFIGHAAGTVVPYVDEYVYSKDVTVVNANEILARATAEGAVAMMTAGAYRLPMYNRMFQEGGWADNDMEWVPGLRHQTIGLIGYGVICKEVIRLLKPYEPNILLCSDHCSPETAKELGVTLCDLDELLKKSNIVSLHNTLTSKTRGMLGERELNLMKEGALLVNTARGPIVDEKALIDVLSKERIYAITDVFNVEPLPDDHPFRSLKNMCCFPHVAAYSGYWKKRLALFVIEQLELMTRGEEIDGVITHDRYKRLTPA